MAWRAVISAPSIGTPSLCMAVGLAFRLKPRPTAHDDGLEINSIVELSTRSGHATAETQPRPEGY
jgi:hypothetical protein